MTPHYVDDWLTVYQGDAATVLATLPAESVHCVVTSPPYWGLRDYGTPGQLSLEPTPEAYVAAMVGVFRKVRRVLRSDGTVWLNMGDSYSSGSRTTQVAPTLRTKGHDDASGKQANLSGFAVRPGVVEGLAGKQLVGVPWRLAFALQADGWYLRSDIIWAKPNPMPESVTDRPTKAHEDVFLLSKSARYFYDADAVREPNVSPEQADHNARYAKVYEAHTERVSVRREGIQPGNVNNVGIHARGGATVGRNLRDVWTIATEPYPGAHFATFPRKLVEPCIKAGTSERGVCPDCGAPWTRESVASYDAQGRTTNGPRSTERRDESPGRDVRMVKSVQTTGWRRSCAHDAEPSPAVCLDPFAGTGTVGLVAQSLSRRAILIDLNAEYLEQCLGRNRQTPLGLMG